MTQPDMRWPFALKLTIPLMPGHGTQVRADTSLY